MKKIMLPVFLIVILLGCKSNNTKMNDSNKIIVDFVSKLNSQVKGTATFIEKNGVVSFSAEITGLQPGVHAIHIHEKSDCTAADGSSAGGHWNPTFKKHGKWGDAEYHKGDIGNFTADENGNGTISLTTNEWCIGCADETKNIIGKGLIVHQGIDDFVSQPTGNAGNRLACGGIIR